MSDLHKDFKKNENEGFDPFESDITTRSLEKNNKNNSETQQAFQKMKEKILEQYELEYDYESSRIFKIEFIDSENLLHSEKSLNGKENHPNVKLNIENNLEYKKNSQDLRKEMIKKIEKNKILLTQTNEIFDNLLEFVKYAMKKWSIESIMSIFDWKDFEILIRDILGEFEFRSIRTFRFSSKNKRYEIDIIAKSRDSIFLIDGKHWQSNRPGLLTFRKIAAQQKERVDALISDPDASGLLLRQFHTDLEVNKNKPFKIYPIIVISFNEPDIRWVDSIPIVPIHTFNHFISEFHNFKNHLYYAELKSATIQQTLVDSVRKKRKKPLEKTD